MRAASTTGVTSKLSLTASHTSIMTTWGMSFSNSGLMVEIVTYLRATQDGLYYFVSGAYDEGLMIFMGIDAFDCCGSDILGSPEQYILYAQQPTKNSRDIAAVVYLTAGGFYPLRIVYYNHLQNMNFGLVIHAPDNSNHELTSELFNYHPATATGTCTMYTSSSAIPTNSEGVPTKSDGVPTNSDGVPTNSDGVPTNSLCQPTNSDGVPTGSDGNPIAPTNSDGVPTNSDGVPTNSLGQPTNSDGVPTGSDGNVLSTTSTGSVSVPGPVASVSFVSSVFEFSVGVTVSWSNFDVVGVIDDVAVWIIDSSVLIVDSLYVSGPEYSLSIDANEFDLVCASEFNEYAEFSIQATPTASRPSYIATFFIRATPSAAIIKRDEQLTTILYATIYSSDIPANSDGVPTNSLSEPTNSDAVATVSHSVSGIVSTTETFISSGSGNVVTNGNDLESISTTTSFCSSCSEEFTSTSESVVMEGTSTVTKSVVVVVVVTSCDTTMTYDATSSNEVTVSNANTDETAYTKTSEYTQISLPVSYLSSFTDIETRTTLSASRSSVSYNDAEGTTIHESLTEAVGQANVIGLNISPFYIFSLFFLTLV
ncbi:hypothetical protein B5S32_g4471 [[Candida] boidinii]|nr:hypothetical protein B5S32_g4471 [[Candida] boidinii]